MNVPPMTEGSSSALDQKVETVNGRAPSEVTRSCPGPVSRRLARVVELHIPRSEPVSPELVLVDPELARLERARPERPGPFRPGARLMPAETTAIDPIAGRPAVSALPASPRTLTTPVRSPVAPPESSSIRSGQWIWLVATAALALAFFGVQHRLDGDSPPLRADGGPMMTTRPSKPPPSVSPFASRPKQPNRTSTPRRFVWPPVEGAKGYEMQLFRGSRRVFAHRTRQPRVTLPQTWRYAGRSVRLEPGTYHWSVWALHAGGTRGSSPAVRAQIVIASG
jgi:hypothetical protein